MPVGDPLADACTERTPCGGSPSRKQDRGSRLLVLENNRFCPKKKKKKNGAETSFQGRAVLGAAKVSENAEGQCAPSVGLILSPQILGSEHAGRCCRPAYRGLSQWVRSTWLPGACDTHFPVQAIWDYGTQNEHHWTDWGGPMGLDGPPSVVRVNFPVSVTVYGYVRFLNTDHRPIHEICA